MNTISTTLKEKNLKLTPQRIAVYKYLLSTKAHPSAETIYNNIHEDYPTMSLATVYKTLKTLVSVNLISELNVGENNFRYDGNPLPHYHIQCTCCGSVDDIENFSLDTLNAQVESYTKYKILYNKVYFYGLCPRCQQKVQ